MQKALSALGGQGCFDGIFRACTSGKHWMLSAWSSLTVDMDGTVHPYGNGGTDFYHLTLDQRKSSTTLIFC